MEEREEGRGKRAKTIESEDSDSLFGNSEEDEKDGEDEEEALLQREMEEALRVHNAQEGQLTRGREEDVKEEGELISKTNGEVYANDLEIVSEEE